MVKRILHILFAVILFLFFFQGIRWVCNAVYGIMFLDVILGLFLLLPAVLTAWHMGDFLADKVISWDIQHHNI